MVRAFELVDHDDRVAACPAIENDRGAGGVEQPTQLALGDADVARLFAGGQAQFDQARAQRVRARWIVVGRDVQGDESAE